MLQILSCGLHIAKLCSIANGSALENITKPYMLWWFGDILQWLNSINRLNSGNWLNLDTNACIHLTYYKYIDAY